MELGASPSIDINNILLIFVFMTNNKIFKQFLPGTFNNRVHQVDEASGCLRCLPGMYCDVTGLAEPTGNCSAGYLCIEGATHPQPSDGTNKRCPVGYYCLEGEQCDLFINYVHFSWN